MTVYGRVTSTRLIININEKIFLRRDAFLRDPSWHELWHSASLPFRQKRRSWRRHLNYDRATIVRVRIPTRSPVARGPATCLLTIFCIRQQAWSILGWLDGA